MEPQLRGNVVELGQPVSNWFGDEAYVAWCPMCGAAKHRGEMPPTELECDDCAGQIEPAYFHRYLTPNGFRTDFKPEDNDLDDVGQMAIRTIATVSARGKSGRHWQHPRSPRREHDSDEPQRRRGKRGRRGQLLQRRHRHRQTRAGTRSTIGDGIVASRRSRPSTWLRMPVAVGLGNAGLIGPFGLVSRKETDALYLEVDGFRYPSLRGSRRKARGHVSDFGARCCHKRDASSSAEGGP